MTPASITTRSRTLLLAALTGLSGCAISFEARQIRPGEPMPAGIVYQLPMTRVDMTLRAKLQMQSGGELALLERGARDCQADSTSVLIAEFPAPSLTLDQPRVTFASVPDPNQIYSVDVSSGPFITASHTFNNDELGYATGLKSEGDNQSAEAVLSLAKAVVSIARPAPQFAASMVMPTPVPLQPACKQYLQAKKGLTGLADRIQNNLRQGDGRAAFGCQIVNEAQRLIDSGHDCVEEARKELRTELPNWAAQSSQEQLVTALVDQNEKYIRALEADLAAIRIRLHVDPAAIIAQPLVFRLREGLVPAERGTLPTDGAVCPSGLIPTSFGGADDGVGCRVNLANLALELPGGLNPVEVERHLRAAPEYQSAFVVLRVRPAVAGAKVAAALAPPVGGGYRYRLPSTGVVDVQLGFHVDKSITWGPRVSMEHPIAQFGALVALPSRFSGLSATLDLALTPQGSMKRVALGQQARDPAQLSDSIQGLVDAVRTKPVAVDPLAGLEQSVRQQKLALCIAALSKVAADADTLPALCDGL